MAEEQLSESSSSTPRDAAGLTPVLSDWSVEHSPKNQGSDQFVSSRSSTPSESFGLVSLPRPDVAMNEATTCTSFGSQTPLPRSPVPFRTPMLTPESGLDLVSCRTPIHTQGYLTPESAASCRTPMHILENCSPISDDRDLFSVSPDASQMSGSPVSDLCLPAYLLETTNSFKSSPSPSTLLPEWVNNYSPSIPYFSDSDSSVSIASSDSLSNPEHRPSNTTPDQYNFDILPSTCRWAPHQSGIPFLLKDICMLNVLFRVEEFPVQSLALLPRAIRRRVINGLSHADVLHLGTALYGDLNVLDPFRTDYEQRGHIVACEKLLEVVLARGNLKTFLSLSI